MGSDLFRRLFAVVDDVDRFAREDHMEHIGGVYTLYATYTCVEDIAYTEPIGTDENTDLTPYVAPTENHHL